MTIKDLLPIENIDLNVTVQSKQELLDLAIQKMGDSGVLSSLDTYKEAVYAREEKGSTGIGEEIAIPHAKSDAVKQAQLVAFVIKDGVDFDALDGEKVKLLFLIAAPNTKDNVHLEVLSKLSVLLMDEDFKNHLLQATSKEEFMKVINDAEKEKDEVVTSTPSTFFEVLAVTACPTGIAHTYMAQEALEKKAKEMGVSIKVETNGSGGIKNALTKEEIEHAKGIIVAADTNVETLRFAGKKVVFVPVAKGIHEPEKLIEKALDEKTAIYQSNEESSNTMEEQSDSLFHKIYKHLMSGVSHMLPFVIGGGILIALAFLLDTIAKVPTDGNFGTGTAVSWFLKNLGGYAFNFMLPVLAAYIAYSIAGRPGLAVGLVGGYLATLSNFSIQFKITGNNTGVTAGFIGALIAGFLAGYIVKLLEKIFKFLPKALDGIKPTLIYPVFGILLIGISMFLLNTPFAYINIAITNGLNWLGGHNLTILLGGLLAAMMAIDMGGPINKAAYVFGTGLLTTAAASTDVVLQRYCYQMMAAVMIGGMVPPLGIAIASSLFPQKFNKNERKDATVNYVMGLSFITEGAIPFASSDPLRVIPSSAIGSAVAGVLSTLFGCTLMAPHGGIFVFAVVGNWYLYILALVIGSFLSALLLGLTKKDVTNPELGKFKGLRISKNK